MLDKSGFRTEFNNRQAKDAFLNLLSDEGIGPLGKVEGAAQRHVRLFKIIAMGAITMHKPRDKPMAKESSSAFSFSIT